METRQKEILAFQTQRTINALCKNFLNILEDLTEEYDRYFDKSKRYTLGEGLIEPPENFLTDDHFTYLRKKVLDRGGEATRDLLHELEKYNIILAMDKGDSNEGKSEN